MSESQLALHTKCVYKTNTLKHKISKTFEYNISKRVDGVGKFTVKSFIKQKKAQKRRKWGIQYTVNQKKLCNY